MILSVDIHDKSYGDKQLYSGLSFTVQPGEKLGLIGRNGTGKTTLFNIITGEDTDFDGEIILKKGSVVASSRQEHAQVESMPAILYILQDLPEYQKLKHIIDTYPATMGESMHKLNTYTEAIDRFSQLGYYEVEERIIDLLKKYQLSEAQMRAPLKQLSGGQKRFVELVKVQQSKADLALIDEPTNHMDYIAKGGFIDWFTNAQEAIVVITHDRDVLKCVDRIIEIRDGRAYSFPGNYDDYLRINTVKITSEVNEYTVVQRRITNVKEDIIRFKRLKERARDPGTIARFKSLQERAEKELAELQAIEKPTFWIDRESAAKLNDKVSGAYEEHKARNIKVRARTAETKSSRLLVEVSKLSLGYGEPLFSDITFQLREGERLRLHGRNGAGKSTIVRAILAQLQAEVLSSEKYAGSIACEKGLKVGVYEQEIAAEQLNMTVAAAIDAALRAKNQPINDTKVKQLLSDYLFNPLTDGDLLVSRLSGGQKARLQLIAMLAGDPSILILDEPTNHLDLPSIEELENALSQYHGAVLYISHDSYFCDHLGGQTVPIG